MLQEEPEFSVVLFPRGAFFFDGPVTGQDTANSKIGSQKDPQEWYQK
jgi:hypothetical protein